MGDELFEFVPGGIWQNAVASCLWRPTWRALVWMQQLLQDDVADCVLWMDADVLVFAPQLRIAPQSTCLFGYEYWVQPIPGRRVSRCGAMFTMLWRRFVRIAQFCRF
ncbi:MAG: hypothetical protein CM15mP120_15990 [Pseudomonadota bacterium]|nr:MAG: hypothetical protein CM15mP120_15990 [Pseudomonadota bacterium]